MTPITTSGPKNIRKRIVDWLREQGEEEIAYAVSFHQTAWGLPPKTMMDKCLLACDELTGFVIACCLVRPEGIATLEPKSVKKKLKDKAFAAKVDREIIKSSVELLGVDFDQRYVDPLLVLTGEEYAKMPFQTLLDKLAEAVRSGPRVVMEYLDSDGETHIFTDDE